MENQSNQRDKWGQMFEDFGDKFDGIQNKIQGKGRSLNERSTDFEDQWDSAKKELGDFKKGFEKKREQAGF